MVHFPAKPASGGMPTRLNSMSAEANRDARRGADQAGIVGDLFAAKRVAQQGDNREGRRFMNKYMPI